MRHSQQCQEDINPPLSWNRDGVAGGGYGLSPSLSLWLMSIGQQNQNASWDCLWVIILKRRKCTATEENDTLFFAMPHEKH